MNDSALTSRRAFLGYGLATAGLAAFTLAGCSSTPSSGATPTAVATAAGKVDLRTSAYGSATRQAKLKQVYDLYTAKFGGTINLEILANDQYTQKLSTEIAGGAAADTINLFDNIVAQFASKNTLVDLGAYSSGILDLKEIEKASLSSGVINGKQFAVPLGDNAYGAIYDEGALESIGMKAPKPGHTWDEFATFANDVAKKKGDGYYGTIDDSSDLNGFDVFLRQRGKTAFKGGKLGFVAKDLEDWYQIWADLRKTKAAPPGDLTVQTATGGFGNSLLVAGKAANFFIFPNVLSAFQALTKSTLSVTTMPMPSAAKSGLYIRASNWVGVNAKSAHTPDAVNIVNFMLNDADAVNILQAEFGAAPNQKLRAGVTYNATDQKFIDYVNLVAKDYAHPIGSLADIFPTGFQQILTAFQTVGHNVAIGTETVSSGADSFISQAGGFLS